MCKKFNNRTEWSELSISVEMSLSDIVADFLVDMGSNGILEEAVPGDESMVCLKAYLKNNEEKNRLVKEVECFMERLHSSENSTGRDCSITVSDVPDEDWNRKWRSFFEPVRVTERIVIKPSWKTYHPSPADMVIELDPGMAFGTGTHPSTRMCLAVIEDLTGSFKDLCMDSMLDVGTGSGILSIAAARLGVKNITAIDIDLQAVEFAGKNAEKNGVKDRISLSTAAPGKIQGVFPLVVANILPHVLINMKDELEGKVCKGGFLVLSGILKDRQYEVIKVFSGSLKTFRSVYEDEWACLVFRKGH